jgi:serine/threonine protein kinase
MASADAASTTPIGNALPAGTRLGEFELRRVIGVGGFGIVYLAFDHGLEREVAIKEYMPSSLASRTATLHVSITSPSNAETFALGLRSFVNEARLLARFDHTSLIKVHRFWEDRGTAYMVMPLYRGHTLREVRMGMQAPPDESWMRALLEPLLGALDVLHREDVFHRDIAPDNILMGDDGVPMLLDFGAARHVISDRSQTLTAILKPSYAPIEQYGESASLRQGAWTDIYALGATLHFLVTQAPPAPATTRMVHEDAPPLAASSYPNVSQRFLQVIDWMLAPRPADRPKSVAELREVLAGHRDVPTRSDAPAHAAWQRTAPVPSVGRAKTVPPPADDNLDMDLTIVQPMSVSALMSSAPGPRRDPPPLDAPDKASAKMPAQRPQPPVTPAALPVSKPASSSGSSLRWVAGGAALLVLAAGGFWASQRGGASTQPTSAASAPVEVSQAPPAVVAPPQAVAASVAEPAAAVAVAQPASVSPSPATSPTQAAAVPVAEPSPPVAAVVPAAASKAIVVPAPAVNTKPAPSPAQVAQAERDRVAAANRNAAAANARAPLATQVRDTPPPMLPRLPSAEPVSAQRPAPSYPSEAPAQPPGRGNAARQTEPPSYDAPAQQQATSTGNPREQCGNRLLLALHLCLVRQCVKPQYTAHEECVRVRQIEERAARTPG